MARPRKNPVLTPAEIAERIDEEAEQLALLQRDLRDALILGENTRSLRAAIGETEQTLAALRASLNAAHEAESARRRVEGASLAAELSDEAHRRHAALLEPLIPPSFPSLPEGFSHAC